MGGRELLTKCELLGWTKWKGLHDLRVHALDEWDGVGNHVVPLWVGPGSLATLLPVSQTFVAPDVVDCVQLS